MAERRIIRLLSVVDVACDVSYDEAGAVSSVNLRTAELPTVDWVTSEVAEVIAQGEVEIRSYPETKDAQAGAEASASLLVAIERMRGEMWYD